MAQEIERKFLVSGEFKSLATKALTIKQGNLCPKAGRTGRERLRDNQGVLTIKGRSDAAGLSRFEWEKEISAQDAESLLLLCEPGIVDKTRYLVDFAGHTFEVDEFHGENQGLVMAELELVSEDEPYQRPEWLGEEVTGDRRYYNAYLSKHPFTTW